DLARLAEIVYATALACLAWSNPRNGRGRCDDLHGRNGVSASRAACGMARMVPRPYPGAADRAGVPRLAALRGGGRQPVALSGAARGVRAGAVRERRLSRPRRP